MSVAAKMGLLVCMLAVGAAGHAQLDSGRVLGSFEHLSCWDGKGTESPSCNFGGGKLVVSKARADLRVEYDGSGPYLAVEAVMTGGGTLKEGRFEVTIRHQDTEDGISYKGDDGYDMCCRFIEGGRCAWVGKALVPEHPCNFAGFTGSVKKPLHTQLLGDWTLTLTFHTGDAQLGSVVVPFEVTARNIHHIGSLKALFRPGGSLVIKDSAGQDAASTRNLTDEALKYRNSNSAPDASAI